MPDPVLLNDVMSFSGNWTLERDMPLGATQKLDLYRVFSILGIPLELQIGCFNGFGSCQYELCDSMAEGTYFCAFLKRGNNSCNCPMRAGNYYGEDYEIKLPQMSGWIVLVAQGFYKARWQWLDVNDNMLGCVEIHTRIGSGWNNWGESLAERFPFFRPPSNYLTPDFQEDNRFG